MLIKEDAPKPKKIGVRVWPKAIPQFNLAHNEAVRVSSAGQATNEHSWGHMQSPEFIADDVKRGILPQPAF